TDLAEFTEYHHVSTKHFTAVAEDKVTIQTQVIVLRVSRKTRMVEQGFQQESITSYSPLTDGFIKMTASTKTFDVNGAAQLIADNEAKISRVTPFEPVDALDGLDLKQSFIKHLTKIGYAHLAPVGLKAKQAQ